jgi:hypothetical protein
MELLPIERTIINDSSKLILAGSSFNIELPITTQIDVQLYVWVWTGAQNKTLGPETFMLPKAKVSSTDTYINIEVNEQIISYIEASRLSYTYISDNTKPDNSDLAVFVQWKWIFNDSTGGISPTYIATRGYRWDYEKNSFGISNLDRPYGAHGQLPTIAPLKKYSPAISYFERNFVYGQAIDVATTRNVIVATPIVPSLESLDACQRELFLIVYLNKLGLWEQFTPYGKVSTPNSVDSEKYNLSHRRPRQIFNDVAFSKRKQISEVLKSYQINTDYIDESVNDVIEEIIYSPSIYLVKFAGDYQTVVDPITIDSTLVTIDNTDITIDSQGSDPTKYKTFQQVPVICTTENFEPKTITNDRNKIDYTISFEETTSKII